MSAPPVPPLAIAARVRRWRVATGVSLERLGAHPPLGVRVQADLSGPIEQGDAVLVLPSAQLDPSLPAAVAEVLPDPRTIAGALVVVVPAAPLSGLLARLSLRRAEPIARSVRGAALLLRGYRHIGGGVDPESGLDLVWGE
jgi:hypothetical protein